MRDRVTGLLIEHQDRVEVLGAWDPADTGATSTIYESSRNGPLHGLAVDRGQAQVVGVTAVTEECSSPPGPTSSIQRETFRVLAK